MKISPTRKNERGEGQIGSIIGLIVMIAIAVAP
jgi:FlaG/FlaF family flagellin (archaellin)